MAGNDPLAQVLADRYVVERVLGAGGMATVYLAQDRKHHRPVALKVLHPHLAANLGPERFLREINIAASLQHPHIVPLYDSGQANGNLYYVMPYVDGESLRQRMERERQLPLEDALRLARAMAAALDYAHRHGVVHRDIKPENVMLHDGEAMVADFGIAKALTAASDVSLTQTGMAMGTAAYMSPEQAMGEPARALDWASRALALDPDDSGVLYNVACVYALGGRTSDALGALEKAVHNGFGHREWLENDTDLDSLRDDQRFKALLQRI
jgi:serine/threonine-protein kinase